MAKIIGYIICHVCCKKVAISKLGRIWMHSLPFNGEYYPLCNTTGKIISNIGLRQFISI